MKNKIFILILMLMISLGNYNDLSYAKKNVDLFNSILEKTEGKTLEYGIKASFDINNNGEEYCIKLLKKLGLNNGEVNVVKNNDSYCLEFNNNVYKGYIESLANDNHNVVTVNISKNDSKNGLSELISLFENNIEQDKGDIKYFQYLKAKINDDDKNIVNNKVINILKEQNASNIDTIVLSNGFSTTANTNRYEPVTSDGEKIDFNFAVCSYSSGNYIIIGTPVIITSY
ncbi:YwmB family TATA-box binding protein [Clostridium sp. YIM B02515]|uniref:YwmB family TATA-box binding protein n=1 Tax=Clostridium rhizosphaerae TaxID=2803861 RepID=A0ABS1T943_9CLOT|nr:YwmB family TATA-box binding protein [Clostridium rhizosphaerae]MBL4935786.1 YwmB family TATA-box binding protein [Clostridium rhizosphaerae]